MNNACRLLAVSALTLALNHAVHAQSGVEIALKHGTPAEARTREQLQRLLATYDLTPWIYTKSVVVDEQAIPFSHPVLTLHTRHAKDDDLLVSSFVHEQFHWFLVDRAQETDQAITELRKLFPSVPAGGAAGARDERSTYLHLLVCYLEQQADFRILGELKTKQIMDFWGEGSLHLGVPDGDHTGPRNRSDHARSETCPGALTSEWSRRPQPARACLRAPFMWHVSLRQSAVWVLPAERRFQSSGNSRLR